MNSNNDKTVLFFYRFKMRTPSCTHERSCHGVGWIPQVRYVGHLHLRRGLRTIRVRKHLYRILMISDTRNNGCIWVFPNEYIIYQTDSQHWGECFSLSFFSLDYLPVLIRRARYKLYRAEVNERVFYHYDIMRALMRLWWSFIFNSTRDKLV